MVKPAAFDRAKFFWENPWFLQDMRDVEQPLTSEERLTVAVLAIKRLEQVRDAAPEVYQAMRREIEERLSTLRDRADDLRSSCLEARRDWESRLDLPMARQQRLRTLRYELRNAAGHAGYEAYSPSVAVQAYIGETNGSDDTREDRYAAIAVLMGCDQLEAPERERLRGLALTQQARGWPPLRDRTARDRLRKVETVIGTLLAQKTGNPLLARAQRAEHACLILRYVIAADHIRRDLRGPKPFGSCGQHVARTTVAYDAYIAECVARKVRATKEGFYRSSQAEALALDPRTLQRHLVIAGRTKPRQQTTTRLRAVVVGAHKPKHTEPKRIAARVTRDTANGAATKA